MSKQKPLDKGRVEISAALLLAMANPIRLVVLEMLLQGEFSVGDLVDRVGLSQSALSQHLSKLRAQNLVNTRREAQTIHYSCNSTAVTRVLDALNEIAEFPVKAAI